MTPEIKTCSEFRHRRTGPLAHCAARRGRWSDKSVRRPIGQRPIGSDPIPASQSAAASVNLSPSNGCPALSDLSTGPGRFQARFQWPSRSTALRCSSFRVRLAARECSQACRRILATMTYLYGNRRTDRPLLPGHVVVLGSSREPRRGSGRVRLQRYILPLVSAGNKDLSVRQ